MTDPYEIAITTYALTLCNSIEKEFAFNLLHSTRLEVAGMIKCAHNNNANQPLHALSQILLVW